MLLQPLGHLTKFIVAVTSLSFFAATGRYYREKQPRRQQADKDFFKLFD
ncbi:protein of unknown function [Xenorhabdus poinarii G6]|uniref:Uncharacterized protein n=1 Tax=Xenorhabdus poinarii G6 TaxID=1354304 RepID=A0A068R2U2_9GAMM|nr:protein of unknown function [Xenorhabdus poinarii G6]